MKMLELAAELKWCREQNEILRQGVERCKEVCLETSRLRAENKAAWDSAEYNAQRARTAESTIERLREYAGHRMWCNVMSKDYDREQEGCDCGYDALMAEVGESK